MELNPHWKSRTFYARPVNSRLIIPTRLKSLGWTRNFASTSVWIGLVFVIVILVGVKILTNN